MCQDLYCICFMHFTISKLCDSFILEYTTRSTSRKRPRCLYVLKGGGDPVKFNSSTKCMICNNMIKMMLTQVEEIELRRSVCHKSITNYRKSDIQFNTNSKKLLINFRNKRNFIASSTPRVRSLIIFLLMHF